jgi:transcriptional regulator with XRE-family HTH domain
MDEHRLCASFGAHLRAIRIEKQISQEKLAELAGIDRTYISSMERGKRNVSLINIFKIAHALNLSPKFLLDFTIK